MDSRDGKWKMDLQVTSNDPKLGRHLSASNGVHYNNFSANLTYSKYALIYFLMIYGAAAVCVQSLMTVPSQQWILFSLLACLLLVEAVFSGYFLSSRVRRFSGIRCDGRKWFVRRSNIWIEIDKPRIVLRTGLFLRLTRSGQASLMRPRTIIIWRDMVSTSQWHRMLILLNI